MHSKNSGWIQKRNKIFFLKQRLPILANHPARIIEMSFVGSQVRGVAFLIGQKVDVINSFDVMTDVKWTRNNETMIGSIPSTLANGADFSSGKSAVGVN